MIKFLICFGLVIFFILCVIVIFLIWLPSHPTILIKRMRGNGDVGDENITYPKDFDIYQSKVRVINDLEYESKYHSNNFDLYLPKDNTYSEKIPLLVWVHGGGFISGDKCGITNLATMVSATGYAVIAINYETAPEAKYPAAIIQVNEFFIKLRSLSKEYPQLDLNKIFLGGDSAGAQIASQYAAVVTNPKLAVEMCIQPSLSRTSIKGVILCSGPFDLPAIRNVKNYKLHYMTSIWGKAYFGSRDWFKSEAAEQTVTIRQVTSDYPPTYITDGNVGSFEIQGRRLGEALRYMKVPVQERYFDLSQVTVQHDYLFCLDNENAYQGYLDLLQFMKHYKE